MAVPIRLIDANLNRAREALRVMEDVARFTLGDGDLAGGLKDARHDLRAAAEAAGLVPLLLAAWRDTPGDVGTGLTTTSERERPGIAGIAVAAGKRAGEALRVLEEAAKALPGGNGGVGFKALRYRVYDLEKRLVLALGTGRARQWRLCVLITESLCTHHHWVTVAERALAGGADCLQLREKSLESVELLRRARRLVAIARAHTTAAVIINDRPDIALLCGADGVHLGQTDLSVADARRAVGGRLLIGVSTSNMDEARAAAVSGADYCGVGPMFPTSTKDKPVLAGIGYLRSYLADPATARVPHLAIAGINAEGARELAAAGCLGVAVSSVVCGARDPEEACRELVRALDT